MTVGPRTTTWPVWPLGSKAPRSSMIETSKTVGSPTEPALRSCGGSGLHAMGDEVTSVIPYHSITGLSKVRSSSAKMRGGRGADEERMKRSPLFASRSCCTWVRIAWCIVGTAEYHVGRNAVSHPEKRLTSNPEVHTTLPPAASEAPNVAWRPCP